HEDERKEPVFEENTLEKEIDVHEDESKEDTTYMIYGNEEFSEREIRALKRRTISNAVNTNGQYITVRILKYGVIMGIEYDREGHTNPQGSARTTSAVDLEEFCEKHYEKLLPIMADKYEYEKRKKEKLEEVKARLDFGDARKKSTKAQESAYSESRTISPRRQRRSRSPRHNPSVFTRLRRERSRSPRHEYKNKERRESTVFKRLGSR
ncbi:hypothetical protein Tco_0708707, partial [Tanacetum coccineum]